MRRRKADANIEQVKSQGFELLGQADGFLQGLFVAAVGLDHAEPCGKVEPLGPDAAGGGHRLAQEPPATVRIPALFVGTLVGVDREKALSQIPMGEVQFQPLGPGIPGPLHGGDKSACTRWISS